MLIGLAVIIISVPVPAKAFDVVINNGRVIDAETMLDEILNVGVIDGKIVQRNV